MIPQSQRFVSGNGANGGLSNNGSKHYALTESAMKNNNIASMPADETTNFTLKSNWLFNQLPQSMHQSGNGGNVLDWRDKKNCACLPKVYYKSGQSKANTRSSTNKNILYQSVNKQSPTDPTGNSKLPTTIEPPKCFCQQYCPSGNAFIKRLSNAEIEQMQLNGNRMSSILNTHGNDPMKGNIDENDDDDDDDEFTDVDFRKSVIRINNIYNSCRDIHVVYGNGSGNVAHALASSEDNNHLLMDSQRDVEPTSDFSSHGINL